MRPERSAYLSTRVTVVRLMALLTRSPDGAVQNPGTPIPHSASLHAGQRSCGSINLEQSGGAHAAADAHGDDAVFRAAPLALDQDVAGHPRARHAVGMADRDRAAVDVEGLFGNAEPVAA